MYEFAKVKFNRKVSVVAIDFLFKVNNYSIFHLVSVLIFFSETCFFYIEKIMNEKDDTIGPSSSVTLESSSHSAEQQQQTPDESGRSINCFVFVH